ncbi:MAG TPA: non-homologous end-joining DNA ligase [Frankiaceae bacterium]|nr:non-homologous end-joining DNA ligase [Frankiaceae bacterium]
MTPDSHQPSKVPVEVEGHRLVLSNLDKVLYPDAGFTKGQILDYYTRIAPLLLPHLAGRPLTRKRYPNGVDGAFFFEKNVPRGLPEWIRTARLPSPGSTKDRDEIDFVVVDELATLVYVANLASLELHTPMWKVGPKGAAKPPDMLVIDLDPGPPATIVECCRVAELVREESDREWYPKTSGSKGMQLYARMTGRRSTGSSESTSDEIRKLAEQLERKHPDLVVSRMTKTLRPGKVFIDWSQNNPAKTTISVYSLRARPHPTVSTPISWDEVAACTKAEQLVFEAPDVLERTSSKGDLFAPVLG